MRASSLQTPVVSRPPSDEEDGEATHCAEARLDIVEAKLQQGWGHGAVEEQPHTDAGHMQYPSLYPKPQASELLYGCTKNCEFYS